VRIGRCEVREVDYRVPEKYPHLMAGTFHLHGGHELFVPADRSYEDCLRGREYENARPEISEIIVDSDGQIYAVSETRGPVARLDKNSWPFVQEAESA